LSCRQMPLFDAMPPLRYEKDAAFIDAEPPLMLIAD